MNADYYHQRRLNRLRALEDDIRRTRAAQYREWEKLLSEIEQERTRQEKEHENSRTN